MLNDTSVDGGDSGSDYGWADFDDEVHAEFLQLPDSIGVFSKNTAAVDTCICGQHPKAKQNESRPETMPCADHEATLSLYWEVCSSSVDIKNQACLSYGENDPKTSSREGDPGKISWNVESNESTLEDHRSPLERFRTFPKKPLSVTDFVSPAWCELQYAYNLAKYGRVKQTTAMKRGEAIHRELEEEVRKTVQVDVQTREDAFGLKVWNVIQNLRELRATGKAVELSVWGLLDGQIVNGIIDELSFECPVDTRKQSSERDSTDLPLDSPYLTCHPLYGREKSPHGPAKASHFAEVSERKIYLTDVKTRNALTLPGQVSLRPTEMQLMIYRHLLVGMTSGCVDSTLIFMRYNLEGSKNFSDSMIAQLSSQDFIDGRTNDDTNVAIESNTDTVAELLSHNSLTQLWELMENEFRKTMPRQSESIGRVLGARFVYSKDRRNILGSRTFIYDEDKVLEYIADEMRWWKGEREARGVDIEEAFKCRSCDFAETCTWRLKKVNDAISASREKSVGRISAAS